MQGLDVVPFAGRRQGEQAGAVQVGFVVIGPVEAIAGAMFLDGAEPGLLDELVKPARR